MPHIVLCLPMGSSTEKPHPVLQLFQKFRPFLIPQRPEEVELVPIREGFPRTRDLAPVLRGVGISAASSNVFVRPTPFRDEFTFVFKWDGEGRRLADFSRVRSAKSHSVLQPDGRGDRGRGSYAIASVSCARRTRWHLGKNRREAFHRKKLLS